ncbi:MAG: hypothetical protein ABIV13_01315 [Fimbriimonadales bacterium]
MKASRISTMALAAALAAAASADYSTQVIAEGLPAPTGIAVRGQGPNTTIYWTEVPNPGIPMMNNAVRKMNLSSGVQTLLHMGEPDPQNIALDKFGNVFWTCRSAGVILRQSADGMTTGAILENLLRPTGISVGLNGNVYFTQVPTPGVPGNMGGMNTTNLFDGKSIQTLTMGEPEPTDIVVDRQGTSYWTCKSAGVILKRTRRGVVSLVLNNLNQPTGIALDKTQHKLVFTEVPTPGLPGSMGGMNAVWQYDLKRGSLNLVNAGDPQPTDVAVGMNGHIYWTCTSAGVIVEATPNP